MEQVYIIVIFPDASFSVIYVVNCRLKKVKLKGNYLVKTLILVWLITSSIYNLTNFLNNQSKVSDFLLTKKSFLLQL